MARVDIKSSNTGGSVATGVLQLQNGVAMTTTLTAVTDQSNTASPLLLSTTGVQTLSKIQITTADSNYIDAEDNSGNNRFTVGRDPSSQQVNVDFASNPTGSTTVVGAIRTYVDGVNLSEVMTFREDGRLTIYNTLKSIYDNYSDLGTNAERFANVYALSGRFNNVSTNTLGPLGAATWINISSSVFSLVGGQLSIQGSGSTSATTSLLVQNSLGTFAFEVKDDRTSNFNGNLILNGQILYLQTPTSYPNNYLYQASNISILSGTQIRLASGPVGISETAGGQNADASAVLDAKSTTKGFLPPRMTNAQRSAIASPAEGLQIHNTTNNGVAYYDGTNWGYLSGAKQSITITGATQTIFGGNGNIVALTMQSSTTLTFSNHVVGTYIFQITQGGTGSYTITWPVSVLWSGGTAPTLTTTVGKTDIVTLFHDGTNFYGTYSLNY